MLTGTVKAHVSICSRESSLRRDEDMETNVENFGKEFPFRRNRRCGSGRKREGFLCF